MTLYQYCYLDQKGRKKAAVVEAISIFEAKEKLRIQKLTIVSLKEMNPRRTFFKKSKCQLIKDHLITVTTQLSQLLLAGVPLYESLLSLEEQYRHESFHPIILSLCEQIKNGSSLSSAMERFPDSFSTLYCAMVAAGESIGALDRTLEKLALLLGKQNKLKKMLTTALLYPAILFSFSLIVIGALLCFVIPSLETLFEDRDVNRFTKLVMNLSYFLRTKWMFYIPCMVSAVICGAFFFNRSKWRTALRKRLLYIPLLKTLIIQSSMARFTRTMGTLLAGGVSIIRALQISRKVINHPSLEEIIEEAESKIIEGSLLSVELKKSKLIPSFVPRMLAIGEEGGNAAAMLNKIADFYEEEVEKMLNRLTTLAQPVILILMGAIVGVIMLAVLLPLTDVSAFL